ncbi:MAG: glycerol kinase GlpK [Spirochaetes bacterium]|nr:glycerol kinase GlpK [Spirochaetota bacterium]
MQSYILALDQGTTSSRAILFNRDGEIVATAQKEFPQIYPNAGWVEHDPMDILTSQLTVMQEVVIKAGTSWKEVSSIGITNQRETTILWDRKTGKPVYNAIVWQCRRTAPICDQLKANGLEPYVREVTGLVVDAYFSGTKVKWILDNVNEARKKAEQGNLAFGTVDSWLLWHLTGGKVHATDFSNASRTLLYNIDTLQWDPKLLDALGIPASILPEVKPSSGGFGVTDPKLTGGVEIPVSGIAGDQQAALFGQTCFRPGMAKNTYGTGCFLLMNTGKTRVPSQSGLLTTIAYGLGNEVYYGLEGSVFIAGAVVQWLRDELNIISSASETESLALQAGSNNGVYIVPAFAGLGAPYWDMYARGAIFGLTRGANRAHIVRAALESIAYQSRDVLDAIERDSGIKLAELRVDGGASANNFLMQFQADLLGVPVSRPKITETTALGAAYLAGLGCGFWKDLEDLSHHWKEERRFHPSLDTQAREHLYAGWKKAVSRASRWIE